MSAPQVALLHDGRRLHLQHGPIDLVIEAFGPSEEVGAAYRQARERFEKVLMELVGELGMLRTPISDRRPMPEGPIAYRMIEAVWPHRDKFVTPMAAVAGAVADEITDILVTGRDLEKAYVNNSGDIAFWLSTGAELRLGIVGDLLRPSIDGTALLTHNRTVRGVATSGWRGRSWSLGIADAVTVTAPTAAAADVAATLIANAVDIDHPAVERAPASSLDDQTDLGDQLVTLAVGELGTASRGEALDAGEAVAMDMIRRGLAAGVVLKLQQDIRAVGDVPVALPASAL